MESVSSVMFITARRNLPRKSCIVAPQQVKSERNVEASKNCSMSNCGRSRCFPDRRRRSADFQSAVSPNCIRHTDRNAHTLGNSKWGGVRLSFVTPFSNCLSICHARMSLDADPPHADTFAMDWRRQRRSSSGLDPANPLSEPPETHSHDQLERERRFHYPKEALGIGYEDFNVELPTPLKKLLPPVEPDLGARRTEVSKTRAVQPGGPHSNFALPKPLPELPHAHESGINRERRFHYPREARGLGYRAFDVFWPKKTQADPKPVTAGDPNAAPAASEEDKEPENDLWMFAFYVLLLVVILLSYLSVARSEAELEKNKPTLVDKQLAPFR
jgi:hypothetical protein